MNKRFFLVLSLILMAKTPVEASCQELVEELQAMRRAQQSLLKGLAQNHESFATSIEDMTSEMTLSSVRPAKKSIISMNKTAQAFRQRGLSAKRQTERLDAATEDVISRVADCLRD